MTISQQPVRRGGHYAVFCIGISALAVAALAVALGAEPARYVLAAICNSLRDNVESAVGLAIGLSMLAAFNLAFWRHLRRAYASPRRPWRRDR